MARPKATDLLLKVPGSNAIRTLGSVLANSINAKDFGVKGDGITDDTVNLQLADNFASALKFGDNVASLILPPGTYLVTNIQKGRAEWIGAGMRASFIAAKAGGDARYLITSPSWLVAGSQYGDRPTGMCNLTIDAKELKTNGYVLRSYFTKLVGVQLQNAIHTDLLLSTNAADGTAHNSEGSIGNCMFINCWFGSVDPSVTLYGFRQYDTAKVNTDCLIQDCFFPRSATINCQLNYTVAGWGFIGNHLYGAPLNIETTHGPGFRCTQNIFENNCIFRSSLNTYQPVMIGPANWFWGDYVAAYFENNGATLDQMIFFENDYSEETELRHSYNTATKQLVSQGEVFKNPDPFKFYSGASPSGSSSGVIQLRSVTMKDVKHAISVAFTGVGSLNTDYVAKPSDLLTNPAYADANSAGWHNKSGRLDVAKSLGTFADRNTAINLTIKVPTKAQYTGFKVIVSCAQRFNFTSTYRTQFRREYEIIKHPTNGYYVMIVDENYSSGQWTIAPDVVCTDDGNGYCNVVFTGTPNNTDGYGRVSMKVENLTT